MSAYVLPHEPLPIYSRDLNTTLSHSPRSHRRASDVRVQGPGTLTCSVVPSNFTLPAIPLHCHASGGTTAVRATLYYRGSHFSGFDSAHSIPALATWSLSHLRDSITIASSSYECRRGGRRMKMQTGSGRSPVLHVTSCGVYKKFASEWLPLIDGIHQCGRERRNGAFRSTRGN